MDFLTPLLQQNLVVIYFFYGLAFFTMGVAIAIESGRSSDFPFALAMAPLAAFAILHGLHEWLEMFQLLNSTGVTSVPAWTLNDNLRIAHLAFSFAFLIIFGVQLIYANHRPQENGRLVAYTAAAIMLAIWLISVLATRALYGLDHQSTIVISDVLARYMLAIPGALFAAWAILLEQRTFRTRGMPDFGRALLGAAIALSLYGIAGQLFPKPSVLFPSNVLNSQVFLEITGIPVQLFRTFCAILMTLFIVRALRAFDLETQLKLTAAQQAQELAQDELGEAMRNLSSLYSLSRGLAKTINEEDVLAVALNEFVNAEPHIDAGMIFWCVDEDHESEPAVMTQCPADPTIKANMYAQAVAVGKFVMQNGQAAWWDGEKAAILENESQLDRNFYAERPAGSTAGHTVGVVLASSGNLDGSLVMCTRPSQAPFSSREYSLINTAAEQISIAAQNARLYRELQDREELRGELLHQVVTAQEMERQRIARELHDGPAQTLTALGLGLAAAQSRLPNADDKVAQQVADLRELCGTALTELRDVLADLRPSVLDDLGLVPALRGQVQSFETRSGVESSLHISEPVLRLPPEIETVIFRIVQESLSNIQKHASAHAAQVELTFQSDHVHLLISDDGRGFDVQNMLQRKPHRRQAWGLLGLQERVALAGGSCTITSTPGLGTIIDIEIPVQSSEGRTVGEN